MLCSNEQGKIMFPSRSLTKKLFKWIKYFVLVRRTYFVVVDEHDNILAN
jgi:hypothetical protein